MSQVAATSISSRQIALARRKALSAGGKAALKGAGSSAGHGSSPATAVPVSRSAAAMVAKTTAGGSARAASLARREAMSSRGKAAVDSQDRINTGTRHPKKKPAIRKQESAKQGHGCSCGGAGGTDSTDIETTTSPDLIESSNVNTVSRTSRARRSRRPVVVSSTAKTAALARRKALSSRGKAGISDGPMTQAQVARASNPKLSGRELAKVLRDQRSKRGAAGQKKSAPCGRVRKPGSVGNSEAVGAAQDAPWKVGASETSYGQVVTGTMVGRKENMTGDEPGTCRTITGTEYLGADIFNKFCQSGGNTKSAGSTASKVIVTNTSHGNMISGNRIGRGTNVTGNESGTCKRVTGDEYVSAEQTQGWCGELAQKTPRKISMVETMKGKTVTGNNVGRSERVTGDEYGMRKNLTGTQYTRAEDIGDAPAKVGVSDTLRGGSVTGTMVGRRERMTGDETGSCKNVSGDDYIGKEQFSSFCKDTPRPDDSKVGLSQTFDGMLVTGSMAGRSQQVTGNEPGTCKSVTGTPYSGGELYKDFCSGQQVAAAQARMQPSARSWGKSMTGQQPGIDDLTGAEKGACEPVSGTPYVGAEQAAAVCPATAAEPGSPDFPQSVGQAPWTDFSVAPPAHAAHYDMSPENVTGAHYETGNITGPFGMASGKVTGTEQARFDRPQAETGVMPATAQNLEGRVKSRITGEGMDSGQRITGDDWDRGDQVTGTEGASATRRNPTRRGGVMSDMQQRADMSRPEDIPVPVSKVTGGSGNTDKGSLITYSGGARG